jgi:hypothetical protein
MGKPTGPRQWRLVLREGFAAAGARVRDGVTGAGFARVALFVGGVGCGVACIVATTLLGRGLQPLFDRAAERSRVADVLEIRPIGEAIEWAALGAWQSECSHVRLHPVIEARGHLGTNEPIPIVVLALDLVADPRLRDSTRTLSEGRLHDALTPAVLCSPALARRLEATRGTAVRLVVGDRSATFLVSRDALPESLAGGRESPVVAVDIGQFLAEFGAPGYSAIVASHEEGLDAAANELARVETSGAYLARKGERSDLAVAWCRLWSRAAGVLVGIGTFTGLLLIGLSSTTTFERQRRGGKVTPNASAVTGFVDLVEVALGALVAALLGMAAGSEAARLLVERALLPGAEFILDPERLRAPVGSVAALTGLGVGIPAVWAFVVRLSGKTSTRARLEPSRAPLAVSGILLSAASAFLLPFGWPVSPWFAFGVVFVILIAVVLAGRPALLGVLGLFGRARWLRNTAPTWIMTTYVRESTTPLLLALAILTFSFAAVVTSWIVTQAAGDAHAAWLEASFPDDLSADVLPAFDRGPDAIRDETLGSVRDQKGVRAARSVQRLGATVSGWSLDVEGFSNEGTISMVEAPEDAPEPPPGCDGDIPCVPVWTTEATQREIGRRVGDGVTLETETGSWPGYLAGTLPAAAGRSSTVRVRASDAVNLTASRGVHHASFDLESTADAGAVLSNVEKGASSPPLLWRHPGLERALHVRGAADILRAVELLVFVLLVLTACVAAVAGAAIACDAPGTWPILTALGVSTSRFAASAAFVVMGFSGSALILGAAVGLTVGISVLGGMAPTIAAQLRVPGVLGPILAIGAVVWGMASLAGFFALRITRPWRIEWTER